MTTTPGLCYHNGGCDEPQACTHRKACPYGPGHARPGTIFLELERAGRSVDALDIAARDRMTEAKPEDVHHPAHYTKGIECWDYVVSQGLGFLEGNVIKYVTRYRHKHGLKDLLKARQYLERLIKEHGGTPNTEF